MHIMRFSRRGCMQERHPYICTERCRGGLQPHLATSSASSAAPSPTAAAAAASCKLESPDSCLPQPQAAGDPLDAAASAADGNPPVSCCCGCCGSGVTFMSCPGAGSLQGCCWLHKMSQHSTDPRECAMMLTVPLNAGLRSMNLAYLHPVWEGLCRGCLIR